MRGSRVIPDVIAVAVIAAIVGILLWHGSAAPAPPPEPEIIDLELRPGAMFEFDSAAWRVKVRALGSDTFVLDVVDGAGTPYRYRIREADE